MSSIANKSWLIQCRDFATSPLGLVLVTACLGYAVYVKTRRVYPTYDDEDLVNAAAAPADPQRELRNLKLTEASLAEFNSLNPSKDFLLALNGTIYDVSTDPDRFGPGGCYENMAGCDVKPLLSIMAHDMQVPVDYLINEWKIMLEDNFSEAGYLVTGTCSEPNEEESDASEIESMRTVYSRSDFTEEEAALTAYEYEDARSDDDSHTIDNKDEIEEVDVIKCAGDVKNDKDEEYYEFADEPTLIWADDNDITIRPQDN